MSKRNEAFHKVMSELKGRIKDHSSERLRRKAQDPVNGGEHEEPDGDEDSEGREPAGPEEKRYGHGLKAIEHDDLGGDPSDRVPLDDEAMQAPVDPKWAKEAEGSENCNHCGAVGEASHAYCPHCGKNKR